jgi:hypothetical protein
LNTLEPAFETEGEAEGTTAANTMKLNLAPTAKTGHTENIIFQVTPIDARRCADEGRRSFVITYKGGA